MVGGEAHAWLRAHNFWGQPEAGTIGHCQGPMSGSRRGIPAQKNPPELQAPVLRGDVGVPFQLSKPPKITGLGPALGPAPLPGGRPHGG